MAAAGGRDYYDHQEKDRPAQLGGHGRRRLSHAGLNARSTLEDGKSSLSQITPFVPLINDTPFLLECQKKACTVMSQHLAGWIADDGTCLRRSDVEAIVRGMPPITNDQKLAAAYEKALLVISQLPGPSGWAQRILAPDDANSIQGWLQVLTSRDTLSNESEPLNAQFLDSCLNQSCRRCCLPTVRC